MQLKYRPSETRGGGDHRWLKTFHTFSFADWYDPAYSGFGHLRVINEDRVAPGQGFPTHPHREFEIFSYIVSGQLSHKDSMGNVETMDRGDVQMTSGGTGIKHSEYNDHKSEPVHFLQIWAKPNQYGLPPQYYTRHFTDDDKLDKICEIVAPVNSDGVVDQREGSGPTPVHSPVHAFATILTPGTSLTHVLRPTLRGDGAKLFYAQLVQTSGYNTGKALVDGTKSSLVKIATASVSEMLGEGDGVFGRGGNTGEKVVVENTGNINAEMLIFEMDA